MEFEGWHDLPPDKAMPRVADLPLDEAMARVHDLFVTHYDDPAAWAFAVWLKLTEADRRTAKDIANQRSRSY